MDWARILAFVTGMVDQELLARNEYLAAENRILKAQLKGRLKLSDAERATLGEIGHRLGRQVLGEVANVARPETILAWYRKLVARTFDGSKARRSPGRPRIKGEVEQLIVRMAKENRDWGYDRIAGALANLGTRSAIRRSAMSCNATLCRPRQSANARQPGRLSFGPIWRCWLGPTP
jgi:putative transposase